VSPTWLETPTEKLPLGRHEVIDAGAGDEKPFEITGDYAHTSGNAFEPSCMCSNLQPYTFGPKVRTRGPRPSICVRTFSLFTMMLGDILLERCGKLHTTACKQPFKVSCCTRFITTWLSLCQEIVEDFLPGCYEP
jgi:hypothetical protein